MTESELSFITFTGRPARGREARATNKVVRAHVMRRYKHQQRAAARKRVTGAESDVHPATEPAFSPSPGVTGAALIVPCSPKAGPRRCGHRDTTLDMLEMRVYPQNSAICPLSGLLDGTPDPFSSLPIRSTSRTLMLLQNSEWHRK